MNWKKAVTIGLLSITAIGLVGCAIILKQQKPTQTNASYYYSEFRKQNNIYNFDINGTLERPEANLYLDNPIYILQSKYMINVWDNGYHRYASLFLDPIEIVRGQNDGETADYVEFIYFSETEPPHYRMGDLELNRTKEIKSINLYQKYLSYNPQTNCDVEVDIKVTYTDNTFNQSNFNYLNILDSVETDDFEIDFEDTTTYTVEYINIQNTITALTNYYNNSTPYQDGYDEGELHGYDSGYADGYQTKGDLADGNFLSLRDTMLSVLTMPFTFINKAFDVTLWEGTAYEFNIGNFIKGMIAIAAILFIIRLFTSGFSIIGNYTGGITNSRLDRQQKRANIEYTKAKTANVGKPKEIHSTSEHTNTSHIYTHKDK